MVGYNFFLENPIVKKDTKKDYFSFSRFVKNKFSFSISENTTIGSSVGGILATDDDVSAILSTVHYDWNTTSPILDFSIDDKTGKGFFVVYSR